MPTNTTVAFTLPFAKFWSWLQSHPNCIVRAGTPEVVLYDDDELHWHFAHEEDGTLLVQVLRGKKLYGEMVIAPGDVVYVQVEPAEADEFRFELLGEGDSGVGSYHFVLSHGYEDDEEGAEGRRFTH